MKLATFVSKEAAFKSEQKKMPLLYANVPSNPLPDSWIVKLKDPNDSPKLGREIQAQVHNPAEKSLWPGVNDVKWGDKTTKRVLTVAEVISHRLPRRDRAARDGVDAAHREHDPPLDLRAPA